MFARGQRVRDCYGKLHTVQEQRGTTVLFTDGDWAHETKVFAA